MTPKERLTALRDAELDGKPIKMTRFWGHRPSARGGAGPGCLSQWWPVEFTVDGVAYPSAEHWMMAAKARLFGDEEGLDAVLASEPPRDGTDRSEPGGSGSSGGTSRALRDPCRRAAPRAGSGRSPSLIGRG